MKTIKTLTAAALAAMFASAFMGCSSDGGDDPVLPLPPAHEHTYAAEWTSNETHHWHAATCGHTDQVKDKAEHDFPETWTEVTAATEEEDGLEERFCSVCEYRETRIILMLGHNHNVDRNNWTSDETNHWHAADCGRPAHNEDFAPHTEDSGTVTTAVTLNTEGVRTYKCTVCGKVLRTEPITKPILYESPIDVETGMAATKSSRYIYFGVFPKSVLPANSTVTVDETISVKMGAHTYCKGSDGEYYAKVKEIAHDTGTEYKYSDGTQAKQSSSNSYRYFKVEPIKWKVITDSYSGKCLLLAEDILTANVPYYEYNSLYNERSVGSDKGISQNNYKYSQIRAYLNGLDYYYDQSSSSTVKKTDYTDKGFLQTAFTAESQNLIAVTTVDNSHASTIDSDNKSDKGLSNAACYACADTEDKIFLLSIKEATSYGFPAYDKGGSGNARIRKPTDYAMSNYASYDGWWFLRSPIDGYCITARYVDNYGSTFSQSNRVDSTDSGVVPALSISLQ